MNKKYISGVIIVEGKHDVSKLSNFYESVYVITNGYEIPNNEIIFIKALKPGTQIIVLTDNDNAGKEIRDKVNEIRNDLINIEITARTSSKKKGIAECDNKDIQKVLDKYVSNKINKEGIDLYKLGLIGNKNSKELREYIRNKFNLGNVNTNNLINRLNLLGIKKEDLIKEINNATSK